jgi:hypothetical protein
LPQAIQVKHFGDIYVRAVPYGSEFASDLQDTADQFGMTVI